MNVEKHRVSELAGFSGKQSTAYRAMKRKKFVLFGGARGPGKSYWLRWALLLRLLWLFWKYKIVGVRVGLFCEDYPQLKDRQISKISREFPQWLGVLKESQEHGLGFHLRPQYGSGVLALRNLDDPSKYQSAEFAGIGIDELTKNKAEVFDILRGSLRWAGVPDAECKFLAATNPGSVGHLWVKSYWIDKQYPVNLQSLANEFEFVRALPDDNPHLDPAYWHMLETLTPDLARAWRWGDWDVFAGQVFTQWRMDRHVVDPFEIPAEWKRWRAVDWGYTNPFACYWLSQEPTTGRVVVYRELYERGWNDREQATEIRRLTGKAERVSVTYGDPSMWTKKTFEDRTFSTADEYARCGVPMVQADNHRLNGKRKLDMVLADLEDGYPGLVVFRTCTNLIRTLPALPYDKVNVEDVDSDGEDHAYDALRYALTPINPRPRRLPEIPKRKSVDRVERLIARTGMAGKDL